MRASVLMIFPSFGDAPVYEEVGAACAAALASPEGDPFTACYHPLRPVGMAVWAALPHFAASDAVEVAYATLALNILLLAGVFLAFMRVVGPVVTEGWPLARASFAGLVFVLVLANLVPHLPVTLADLPSLALFMPAVVLCARILLDTSTAPATRRYLLAGLFTSLAALVRQHYLVFGVFLLLATLWLDRARPVGPRGRLRHGLAFAAGLAPVLLQVAAVYAHSGEIWFYETGPVAATFGRPNKERIVEALFFTSPYQGGFMVKLAEPRSFATVIVLRLFSGLFKFQWAVYQGHVDTAREWWTPTLFEIARAYAMVAAWAALAVGTFLRGPVSLRLLSATAVPSALAVPWFGVGHTELRYFLFPRIVLGITVLYWLGRGLARARQSRREAA